MIDHLSTEAERKAEAAEQLQAFSGLKLLHIKRQLEILLGLIGRDGIFDQYTRHDISHIDAMLGILDWLIPEATKKLLTPADWLTIVLAIYFHDLGMLVTPGEYEKRKLSGFPAFIENKLFQGDQGKDYQVRLENLSPEERERFLYQEFVRSTHAERVKWWIMGESASHLGITHEATREVDKLLGVLPQQFRRGLGLVCESHHREDLGDFGRYKTSQPYGNSAQETVNLHYACLLLRTSDLLHITQDRTPSIEFRLINPADPTSQEEWAKQQAVTNIRAQVGKNAEGNLDELAPRDTIEVFAYFAKEDGFFGLTSYLNYVREELRRSFDWSHAARQTRSVKLEFPWRRLDDSNVEAQNFLPKPFGFTIDQARILDLLTGHTLYNDTGVVLRELVQNSLDAVRLKRLEDRRETALPRTGSVQITWNSQTRILGVTDTGTGMTQKVIEQNLLRVGSSRYQDPEFKKKFPEFSSISRFGIGVLSTFMIADSVEITTCSESEEMARQLSLRSVQGRYLIKLVKKDDERIKDVFPHGTCVTIEVRPSASVADILETARRWFVVPECGVTVSVDGSPPVSIGFSSPGEFLEHHLQEKGEILGDSEGIPQDGAIRVEQREQNGITLAYAVEWSETIKEWSFHRSTSEASGTCVEGVRVESGAPGFDGRRILACCNARGARAPKTNVARSKLEITPERDHLLASIYAFYAAHVTREVQNLQARGFSRAWAAAEAKYLLGPLLSRGEGTVALDDLALESAIAAIPMLVVEEDGLRDLWAPGKLRQTPRFWTIEWPLFNWAERLVSESTKAVSVGSLIGVLGYEAIPLPVGAILCSNTASGVDRSAFRGRQVVEMAAYPTFGRVDLCWQETSTAANLAITERVERLIGRFRENLPRHHPRRNVGGFTLASPGVRFVGIANPSALRTRYELILLNGTFVERCRTLASVVNSRSEISARAELKLALLLSTCAESLVSDNEPIKIVDQARQACRTCFGVDALAEEGDMNSLVEDLNGFVTSEFDVYGRSRSRDMEDEDL